MNGDYKAKLIVFWHKLTYSYHIPYQSYWELLGLPRFTLYEQRGWHPDREAMAKCGLEETLARGPLPVLHMAMGLNVKKLPRVYIMLQYLALVV